MDQTAQTNRKPIKRALISVFYKDGLEDLAKVLDQNGVEIVSTGSTASSIEKTGVKVTRVEELTGFPECLDGRVKTLHPRIHAGILADLREESHRSQLAELDVQPFDLVIVNLYPFSETVAAGGSEDDCIEKIDIGGPSMVRAAAKNHPSVAVVVDPDDYEKVIEAVTDGGFTLAERKQLARKAFQHTASYDVAVANWMQDYAKDDTEESAAFPQWSGFTFSKLHDLRYGENAHQQAASYVDNAQIPERNIATAIQLGGKEMSYNNYIDADAAMRAAYDFSSPTVAIVKHSNPCGIASGETVSDAYSKAFACDPVSAYGGVIAANREVTLEMAELIRPVFTEVIIAPKYTPEALQLLQEKKKNLRILEFSNQGESSLSATTEVSRELRQITGGALLQDRDLIDAPGDSAQNWLLTAGEPADAQTLADLEFAWRSVRAVKSNAIVLVKDTATVGVGMGQVNRLDSCDLAISRANTLGSAVQGSQSDGQTSSPERARGSVAASDAFFPFADGLEKLIAAGVKAVVHPGGSMRDEEVIAAAQKSNITLYQTNTRHFYH